MAYTTPEAVADYMGVTLSGDVDAIANLIRSAERDIDWLVGPWPKQPDGSKFGDLIGTNLLELDAGQIVALRDATSAQVEYRLQMGDAFFIEDQRQSVSGPDSSETGKVGRVGPKARAELIGTGLLNLTGRAS